MVDQCHDFPFWASSSVNRWQIQRFWHICYLEPGSAYNWMAPELMRREAVAEEVDVYGFFVTMWEFFTGNIPWRNHDWKAIFNKVWNLVLQLEFCVTTGILCYNWNLVCGNLVTCMLYYFTEQVTRTGEQGLTRLYTPPLHTQGQRCVFLHFLS